MKFLILTVGHWFFAEISGYRTRAPLQRCWIYDRARQYFQKTVRTYETDSLMRQMSGADYKNQHDQIQSHNIIVVHVCDNVLEDL